MNWNDYEEVWKRQRLPVGADADPADLRRTFESRHRKLAATLLVRDLAEAGAGVFVSGAIVFLWWKTGRQGWPLGLALALILGVTGFFIRERVHARRRRLPPGAPLLTKVEADIAELHHQRRLLLKVRTWYLAPIFASMVDVGATLRFHSPPWGALRDPWIELLFLAFYILLCWLVAAANRREVRRRLDPRIAELEKLRADLLAAP